MTVQEVKQRFGIIGSSPLLDIAINTAMQVAPTDISVLVTGESGVGKESFPQIIHHLSARKHGQYIAVNCGAIPEGTIDSELFGHEKGSFTGAHEARKGYFEVANGGTIFLDEVAELPLSTQVRLLRVLETGEFIKVGASKVIKTDVRIVAATNVNIPEAIQNGKFREDLFYRLSTVPIVVPSLRQRKDDINLLFRKFAADFANKYRMPALQLYPESQTILADYRWPGNIRQLKNIAEQISILEKDRSISPETLLRYLPQEGINNLPVLFKDNANGGNMSERDLLYKILFDMRKDVTDLKKLVFELLQNSGDNLSFAENNAQLIQKLSQEVGTIAIPHNNIDAEFMIQQPNTNALPSNEIHHHEVVTEESLSLQDREIEMIKKALEKYKGKRKYAANELGISERTLYRKINEYNIK
jgi:transcriptional regulator with PAS, ATPase and Fis domain